MTETFSDSDPKERVIEMHGIKFYTNWRIVDSARFVGEFCGVNPDHLPKDDSPIFAHILIAVLTPSYSEKVKSISKGLVIKSNLYSMRELENKLRTAANDIKKEIKKHPEWS